MTSTHDQPVPLRRLTEVASSNAPTRASVTKWQRGYTRTLVVFDLIAVALAVGTAHLIRFGPSPHTQYVGPLHVTYLEFSIFISVALMAGLSINNSRSERVIGSGAEEYRRVWIATGSVFGGVAIVSMLFKLEVGRVYLMIAFPAAVFLLFLFRWAARRTVVRLRRKHGSFVTRMLAVGNASAVRDLAQSLARDPGCGYELVGACIPDARGARTLKIPGVGSVPIFGDESTVAEAVTTTKSHAVAVNTTEQLDGRRIRDLSWDLEKLDVDLLVAPGVVDVAGPRLEMRPVAGLPLIHMEKPQYHGAKRFEKRVFDVVFSASVLLIGLPFLILIAVAIKLTSKGPIFYYRECVGLNRKTFGMIKFRTMVEGADALGHELAQLDLVASPRDPFKFVDDPRVTPVGRILRKYSLDELPQFINVLKREMSVVGPRPEIRSQLEAHDDYAMRRLLVRPGITGLWQVSGRSDLSTEDSLRLDLFYVENWSMIADLLIALKTLKAVFVHSGAY